MRRKPVRIDSTTMNRSLHIAAALMALIVAIVGTRAQGAIISSSENTLTGASASEANRHLTDQQQRSDDRILAPAIALPSDSTSGTSSPQTSPSSSNSPVIAIHSFAATLNDQASRWCLASHLLLRLPQPHPSSLLRPPRT